MGGVPAVRTGPCRRWGSGHGNSGTHLWLGLDGGRRERAGGAEKAGPDLGFTITLAAACSRDWGSMVAGGRQTGGEPRVLSTRQKTGGREVK